MNDIKVDKVQSSKQLDSVFEIRQKVFVEEQEVDPAIEYDEFEETSEHYIATYNQIPAGTARWRTTPNGIKLERFAVLKNFRNIGIGSSLITTILNELPNKKSVYLHSQIRACALYRRHGFKEVGPEFMEAGIRHYKMIYKI